MKPIGCVINITTGESVVQQLALADTMLTRFVGLQFRRAIPSNFGLLLTPCASVHTCCVRFPIDVAFLDAGGTVLDIRRNVQPWRVAIARQATWGVLETGAGGLDAVQAGNRLGIHASLAQGQLSPKIASLLVVPPAV